MTPPKPIRMHGFQRTFQDAFVFISNIAVFILNWYSTGNEPDNTSGFYFLGAILILAYVLWISEKHRALYFLKKDPGKMNDPNEVAKYIFSFVILIEKCEEGDSCNQIHTGIREFINNQQKSTYFQEALEICTSILVESKPK